MPTPTYTALCTAKKTLARDIVEFRLQKPAGFTFKAGQFVLFSLPLIENPADIQTRAFSIASAPYEDDLLFVAKLLKGGRASRFIEERLEPGVAVSMQGPFGLFTLRQSFVSAQDDKGAHDDIARRDILMVATSTGVAPFRGQILEAIHAGFTGNIDLLFTVRSEADIFWKEELESIAARHPNVKLHISLTDGSDEWTDHRGRVQTVLPQIAKDLTQRQLYVCGNPAMVKELRTLALTEWGMAKEDVHGEGYI